MDYHGKSRTEEQSIRTGKERLEPLLSMKQHNDVIFHDVYEEAVRGLRTPRRPLEVILQGQSGAYDMTCELARFTNKNPADFAYVADCQTGLQKGYRPTIVDDSSKGNCYYMRGSLGTLCGVFKPMDEEVVKWSPESPDRSVDEDIVRRGVPLGTGYVREVIAYLLDNRGFSGVPPTVVARVYCQSWEDINSKRHSETPEEKATYSSLDSPCSDQSYSSMSICTSCDSNSGKDIHNRIARSSLCRNVRFCRQPRRGLGNAGSRSRSVDGYSASGPYSANEYLLEDISKFLIIPLVDGGHLCEKRWAATNRRPRYSSEPYKVGSLQQYVSHHSCADDVAPELIPVDAVQRLGVLDIRIFNTDRHGGNILFQTTAVPESPESYQTTKEQHAIIHRSDSFPNLKTLSPTDLKLVPIDHGLCLPRLSEIPNGNSDMNADCIQLEWMSWPQAKVPFTSEVVDYVQNLDTDADVALIQRVLGDCIVPEELLTLRVCTKVLQIMVERGKTLYEIGYFFQSGGLKQLVEEANVKELIDRFHEAELTEVFMNRFCKILRR